MAAQGHPTRRRLYEILERGVPGDRAGNLFHGTLIALVVVSVTGVVLQSDHDLGWPWSAVFGIVEWVTGAALAVELSLRLWCAPEHAPLRHLSPWRARLRLLGHPGTWVDILAILPFLLALFVPSDLRTLLVLRLIRFFKLARYSPAMSSLFDAMYAERRALFGCLVILCGAVLVCASVMHALEGELQPDKFGSIPKAAYWAVITLTTVGYGDIVPLTPWGKAFASVAAVAGLVMLALPVGIVASAFSREIHRRDFVVTWSMVARVPIFSGLDAGEVAEIMRFLRAQSCEPGEIIVRKGDPAESMFFIASGSVELDLPDERVTLGAGQFFGEVAVLRKSERSGTVRAVSAARLLVLDAADLHHLMDHSPEMGRRIREIARTRIARERIGRRGDVATEELE